MKRSTAVYWIVNRTRWELRGRGGGCFDSPWRQSFKSQKNLRGKTSTLNKTHFPLPAFKLISQTGKFSINNRGIF